MIRVYLMSPPPDSPYFYAQWVVPGTSRRKTRSLKTTNEKEAERLCEKLQEQLNEGIEEKKRLKFAEFLERYDREKLAEIKEGPRARAILERFHQSQRPASVADVTSAMLSEYAALLREEGMKPPTIKKHLAWIRAGLRWAWRMGLIRECPHVESVRVLKKRTIRTLPAQRYQDLLDAMPSTSWKFFAEVAWHTGMRREELFTLRWHEQDKHPWVNLQRERIVFPAEGNKAGREDWIPIHPDILPSFRQRLDRQSRGKVFAVAVNLNELSREFREHCERAGLAIKLHDIRRSFGTRYAPLVPAHILQRLMRHADIKTTMEFYADVDQALDDAIRKG